MERDTYSWRHLFALLVTAAAAYGAVLLSRLPQPAEIPAQPVMHIRMLEPPPPPPPPPVPVKSVTPSPAPPAPHVTRTPVVSDANPNFAAPPAAPMAATAPAAAPPAAISSPAPPSPDASATLEAAYGAKLKAAVEAQKHYPTSKDAMIQQPRGTVAVWVLVDRAGTLVDAGIDTSHGGILNQAALQSVHRASYPPFPSELYPGQAQHRFVVSLDYTPQ